MRNQVIIDQPLYKMIKIMKILRNWKIWNMLRRTKVKIKVIIREVRKRLKELTVVNFFIMRSWLKLMRKNRLIIWLKESKVVIFSSPKMQMKVVLYLPNLSKHIVKILICCKVTLLTIKILSKFKKRIHKKVNWKKHLILMKKITLLVFTTKKIFIIKRWRMKNQNLIEIEFLDLILSSRLQVKESRKIADPKVKKALKENQSTTFTKRLKILINYTICS